MHKVLALIIIVLCEAGLSDRQSEEKELLRMKRADKDLADCKKCGLSFENSKAIPVIVNGTNVASAQKYPWMVALIQSGTDHIFCGGAIISHDFILTAGHCMVDEKKQEQTMSEEKRGRGGRKRNRGKNSRQRPKFLSDSEVTIGFLTPGWYTGVKPVSGAADIIVHPEYYYEEGKAHDIALIRLQHPINCNNHANPICLPPKDVRLDPKSLVKISGFGEKDPANPSSAQELSEAKIQVVDTHDCENMGFQEEDLNKMYCLKGYKGETPCFGDSGGSMFAKLYNKNYVTLGVASLQSSQSCDSRANVIYTSVANHLSWIHETMQGGQKNEGGMEKKKVPEGDTKSKNGEISKGKSAKRKGCFKKQNKTTESTEENTEESTKESTA